MNEIKTQCLQSLVQKKKKFTSLDTQRSHAFKKKKKKKNQLKLNRDNI